MTKILGPCFSMFFELTEEQYRQLRGRIHDTQRKCSILAAHSLQVQEEVTRYNEYTARIKAKLQDINSHRSVGAGGD